MVLEDLEAIYIKGQLKHVMDIVLDHDQPLEDDTIGDVLDMAVEGAYKNVCNSRYIDRQPYRKGMSEDIFRRDLYDDETGDQLPWLTDEEFLQKYRCHRSSLHKLVSLIKDHPVFHPPNERTPCKKQAPVVHQLMVFLHYVGTSGSGANNPRTRNVFGFGRGTAQLYRNRMALALRSLRGEAIKWPDEEERKSIANRILTKYNIPNCIAIADGTLFPLMHEPQCDDAPDYHGRKFQYSLSVMIVNDDERYIRYYQGGFPGCAHDSRVYNSTKLARDPTTYFGERYFLIADSAMENSASCVSSYKAPRGHELTAEQVKFNTVAGRLRVTSEHTIGILKGRFPWLRSIPMIITNNERSLTKILKYIDCCVVLHNLLLNWNDESPEEWLDDPTADPFDDAISEPINEGMPKDERRQRLMEYFRDFVF